MDHDVSLTEIARFLRRLQWAAIALAVVWLLWLLALPVAAVANVLLRYAEQRYTHSRLYAGEQPPLILIDTSLSEEVPTPEREQG